MSVPNRFLWHQAPVIAAFGRTALSAVSRRLSGAAATPIDMPGPWLEQTIKPRDRELVRCYVRHVGGDPSAYKHHVPPHMFPQWGFALATKTLLDVDYPLQKALNAGCRIDIHAPLPMGEALHVKARIESIDDNGRRALIRQKVITGTRDEPEALVAHMYTLVPLAQGESKRAPADGAANGAAKKKPRERARVPQDARELGFWRLGPSAGLEFAKLTGDFNPVHWVPAYAKAFGFRNTILHGFSTMARAMEGVQKNLLCGATDRIRSFDVKFTSPLVLPARVGLYLAGDVISDSTAVFVGDGLGGRAYLHGTLQIDSDGDDSK
jgi:acyl dehydratase